MSAVQSYTIRRNSIEAREMWQNASRAILYSLSNCFIGEHIEVADAKGYYGRLIEKDANVTIRRDGDRIKVRFHSNLWIELVVS
jgi:hypothetical protein